MPKYRTQKQSRKCPVLFGFNRSGNAQMIFCGKWSCPTCAVKLSKRWAYRVRVHIAIDEKNPHPYRWFMLTLTMGSQYKTVAPAYAALKKLWNRLRMAINRAQYGQKWQYVAFVEGQPKRQSMPHFHIIMDVQPPTKRNKSGVITKHAIHDWAHKMGWGFEAEFKQIKSDQAASYVAKYVSKGSGVVPRGFRRVRVSHGWTKVQTDPDRKLLVPSRDEETWQFIDRVSSETGVPHEEIANRYFAAERHLAALNSENDD